MAHNVVSFTFTDKIRVSRCTIRLEEPVGEGCAASAAVFIGIDTPNPMVTTGFYLTEQQLEQLRTLLYSVRFNKAD